MMKLHITVAPNTISIEDSQGNAVSLVQLGQEDRDAIKGAIDAIYAQFSALDTQANAETL